MFPPVPERPPATGMLAGGSHMFSGKVVNSHGQAITCTMTIWCAKKGRWCSYEQSGAVENCLMHATPDGVFSVLINDPGVYGPEYARPHVNFMITSPLLKGRRVGRVLVRTDRPVTHAVVQVS